MLTKIKSIGWLFEMIPIILMPSKIDQKKDRKHKLLILVIEKAKYISKS